MYIIYKASFFTWILIREVHVIKGLTIEAHVRRLGVPYSEHTVHFIGHLVWH